MILEKWPKADKGKIDEKFEREERTVKNVIQDISNVKKILNIDTPTLTALSPIPKEKNLFEENKDIIQRATASGAVIISSPNELNSKEMLSLQNKLEENDPGSVIDFQNKLKKAKPGKPGVFVSGARIVWLE